MSINFILIQLIGVVAWIILVISYYKPNTNKILVYHLIASILYCIHYYLLSAYSGLFICILEVVRDFLYYKTDLDKYIFYGLIPIYIIYGILKFDNVLDLLPILSSMIDAYSLTKNKKIILIGAIISYTLWFIYNISVMSVSGFITDLILALSNLSILLFNFNPFNYKEKDKKGLILKK